ncbi:MAG: hypothetical protein MUQ56_04600 [Thermoleophilia bacterium]|nr:hypothetical protein [Thermoleophilia bacterium]
MAAGETDSFNSRLKRVNDAIEIKVPDRVPIMLEFNFFPARYAGITIQDAFYDLDGWLAACEKAIVDFEPDIYFPPSRSLHVSGSVHEILGEKQIKWPGHGVGPDQPFQFVEGEYMTADEYDQFLADPSDFIVRTYLPRIFTALEGLRMLPSLRSGASGYLGLPILSRILATPPLIETLDALSKAARESLKWTTGYLDFAKKMDALGFPAYAGCVTMAPFDVVSDFLRGMRGAMLDMFRCPDKLLAVMDSSVPGQIASAVAQFQSSGNRRVFIPLHRGADGFMSLEQFETFYWPGLKSVILGLIEAGLTPCPFFEGSYDTRLEYLAELPAGKVMARFDRTDLVKAKEVLGGSMCVSGGMPVSLLQTGTREQIEEHTEMLIDTVGKDGGFIMGSSSVLDEVRPELVRAWVDATVKYGQYT